MQGVFFASLFTFASIGAYFFTANPVFAITWLVGIAATLFSFRERINIERKDIIACALILLCFSPLYLIALYEVPHQINTDELTIMLAARRVSAEFTQEDLGLDSGYFNFPGGILYVFGSLAKMMGGINLLNFRILHALFGLAIIAATYLLLRQWHDRFISVAGAIIVGINHSLLMISRMAMRDNVATLATVCALAFFLLGLRTRSRAALFASGAICGLAFYGYFPGRFITGILFLSFAAAFTLHVLPRRELVVAGSIFSLGLILALTPHLIVPGQQDSPYVRSQTLLTPEGQVYQKDWIDAGSIQEGVLTNVINGITFPLNGQHDLGYIYVNPVAGFLDPLTGILCVIGLLSALATFRKNAPTITILTGFVALVFVFSFITVKTPSYTRMLTLLPFIAALSVLPLDTIRTQKNGKSIASIIVAIIIGANLFYAGTFVAQGISIGDDVGGTYRFVDNLPSSNHTIYIVANEDYPYFDWGDKGIWEVWALVPSPPTHDAHSMEPSEFIFGLLQQKIEKNHTILISHPVWESFEKLEESYFPTDCVVSITPDSRLVAITSVCEGR